MNSDLQSVFELVRERTGYPVSVTPSADQQSHVTMRSATRSAPVHAILTNPRYERFANYLVAAQCATLLFKWSDPAGVPDFAVNNEKARFLESKISGKLEKRGTNRASASAYASAVISGILMQLNSTPLEILSIGWCFDHCPTLRDEQETYVSTHLRELSTSLSPQIRDNAPPDIFEKNASMNAAYALNWADVTGARTGLIPYETFGFLKKGEDLLNDLKKIPIDAPDIYRRSVDAWAERLQMSGLFQWSLREI